MAKPKTKRRSTRYRGVRLLENGRWAARYTGPDGAEHERLTFASEQAAHRWRTGKAAEVDQGRHVDPDGGRLTVAQYVQQWQQVQVYGTSTASLVNSHLTNHILPMLGERRLSSVRRSDVQSFVKALTITMAPSTIETIYSYVATIFRSAVEDRLLPESPCRKINLPKNANREVVPPESSEVEALLEAIPQRYRALCVLMAGVGLRRGEAYGLTVDRVDFLRDQTVRVDQQLLPARGGPVLVPHPKTEASNRTIPMPVVVREALAAHLAEFGEGPERLIFTDDKGNPIRANRMNEIFSAAVARARIRPITPHKLRHYYASLLIRRGCSPKAVQRRLGHASITETMDTYGHLWPDDDDLTRKAVDDELTGIVAATSDDGSTGGCVQPGPEPGPSSERAL